jgi:hypothetical protein
MGTGTESYQTSSIRVESMEIMGTITKSTISTEIKREDVECSGS